MAEIKTGPDPARLPWIGSEADTARGGVRGFAGWILAAVIVVVGIGFFLLGSRGEAPAPQQQSPTTIPVESSVPKTPAPSQSPSVARTQKSGMANTANRPKTGSAIAQREQQVPAPTTPRGKIAAPAAKPAPSQVAAKAPVKPVGSQVAAKAAPAAKEAPAQVAAKTAPKTAKVAENTKPKTTAVAETTSKEVASKPAPRPIRTRAASATRPPTTVRRRYVESGPILAAPDFRPPERFGGIVQVGAFTDKRQADLVWRDMVRANAALDQARVSLIQNRDWNGQPFYQFQVATASPQDSYILCRSMQQINLRCDVVSLP